MRGQFGRLTDQLSRVDTSRSGGRRCGDFGLRPNRVHAALAAVPQHKTPRSLGRVFRRSLAAAFCRVGVGLFFRDWLSRAVPGNEVELWGGIVDVLNSEPDNQSATTTKSTIDTFRLMARSAVPSRRQSHSSGCRYAATWLLAARAPRSATPARRQGKSCRLMFHSIT